MFNAEDAEIAEKNSNTDKKNLLVLFGQKPLKLSNSKAERI